MTTLLDLGALDVEVAPVTPTSGTTTVSLGGLAIIGAGDRLGVAIYDKDNQWVTAAPLASGVSFRDAMSEPGALGCGLLLGDAATDEATAKRFLKVFWRGGCRQAARIDGNSVQTAKDGSIWRTFNLFGALNMAGDIGIYPELYTEGSPWQSTTRTFGFMSEFSTRWWATGNWRKATTDPVRYQADAGFRQFKPAGLAYPNPWWIAANGPYHNEAPGQEQLYRHEFFTSTVDMPYQILVTADDIIVSLWLDGEKIYSGSGQEAQNWRQLYQITGTMQPGKHIVAARVVNRRRTRSPMGLIFTIQQLQANGNVVSGPPLLNSAPWWFVSDETHVGWQAADVMTKLLFEGRNRSDVSGQDFQAANLMRPSFDVDRDSAGVAWTDTPTSHELDVGTSVLSALEKFWATYFDATVDPDTLQLNLYKDLGADRSSTVKLHLGSGGTGSLKNNQIDTVEAKGNTALMQLADGTFVQDQSSSSVSSVGRVEVGLSLGGAQNAANAHATSAAFFDENADSSVTFTISITSLDGPQPYRHFYLGDSIGVANGEGAFVKVRVMAIQVTQPDDGSPVQIDLEVQRDRS